MSERAGTVTGSPCIIITTEQLVQTAGRGNGVEDGGNWINLTSEFIYIWKFTYKEPSVSRKANRGRGTEKQNGKRSRAVTSTRAMQDSAETLSQTHTHTHSVTQQTIMLPQICKCAYKCGREYVCVCGDILKCPVARTFYVKSFALLWEIRLKSWSRYGEIIIPTFWMLRLRRVYLLLRHII